MGGGAVCGLGLFVLWLFGFFYFVLLLGFFYLVLMRWFSFFFRFLFLGDVFDFFRFLVGRLFRWGLRRFLSVESSVSAF